MTDEELKQLVESNARAIQALTDQIAELTNDVQNFMDGNRQAQMQAQEERAELRQATLGIANLLASLDQDRPTVLRKLNSIENKVDRLLQRETEQNG
jgi:C4-dicarboxylate-specific signal transduction histidine kinase